MRQEFLNKKRSSASPRPRGRPSVSICVYVEKARRKFLIAEWVWRVSLYGVGFRPLKEKTLMNNAFASHRKKMMCNPQGNSARLQRLGRTFVSLWTRLQSQNESHGTVSVFFLPSCQFLISQQKTREYFYFWFWSNLTLNNLTMKNDGQT